MARELIGHERGGAANAGPPPLPIITPSPHSPRLAVFFRRRIASYSVARVTTSKVARAVAVRQTELLPAPAPIVKWAGGKSRLLAQLLPLLPSGAALMRHVEPFVGGGALFFARRPERALLCDVNPALIATYEAVRDDVHALIEHLSRLADEHQRSSGRAYYGVRERYNRARKLSRAERGALFIYLNKTCFNGLHRVN